MRDITKLNPKQLEDYKKTVVGLWQKYLVEEMKYREIVNEINGEQVKRLLKKEKGK